LKSLSAVLVVLAFAGPAWAGPPAHREVADDVATLVRLGDRARLEGRFAEAEASYRAALALRADSAVALRFALSLAALGKALEAAPILERLSSAAELSDDARSEAARALSDAKKQLVTIELRASLGGASMELDGVVAGLSPMPSPVFVEAGAHTIRARREGFLTAQASIDAKAGDRYVIDLDLLPDPTVAPRWPALAAQAPYTTTPTLEDYFLPPGGPVRAIGLGLALTMGLGGAAALGIADANDQLIADYKSGVRRQNAPSCFEQKPASDLDCQRLAQSVTASRNGNMAGMILLTGAGVGAAVALLSVFLLPPPSFQAGRAGNGHSILKLSPAAGPSFGGLSLEATW